MAEAISEPTKKLFEQYATKPVAHSVTKELGKNEFLKLLTMQMKYQDPTSPMDNKQMATQLATFSSLEQLQNINSALDKMTSSNTALAQSLAQMSLPAMISKTVTANSNALTYNGKDPSHFGYELPLAASTVRVEIRDSNDKVVRTYTSPDAPGSSGMNKISWDGKDSAGKAVASGNYKFVVTAKDAHGADLAASPVITGKVTAVKYNGNGGFVIINGAEISATSVIEVGE